MNSGWLAGGPPCLAAAGDGGSNALCMNAVRCRIGTSRCLLCYVCVAIFKYAIGGVLLAPS